MFYEDETPKRRRPRVRLIISAAAVLGLVGALGWTFFGPGGDLRSLRLRILMDGADPRHRFHRGSDLRGVDFSELDLRWSVFPETVLDGADFRDARLRGARFERCSLRGVKFRNAELRGARFRKCLLEGADLRNVDLIRADLGGSRLRFALLAGADLRGADLVEADLTGVVGLSAAALRRCRNWPRALYDRDMVSTIRNELPLAEIKAYGFASWEDWVREQRKLALSQNGLDREISPPPGP